MESHAVVPGIEGLGLKILYLLIPGIISLGVMKSLGPRKPRSEFEQGLQIFIYGIACYALTGFAEGIYGSRICDLFTVDRWKAITSHAASLATLSSGEKLDANQIALASVVALVLGCILAVVQTRSIPHRVLRRLGLTKRIGEVDIWAFALNTPDLQEWVTVRNHETGKVYQGWIFSYSDGGDERELLLRDVLVFDLDRATGQLIEVDNVPAMYLGLDRKNVVLEFQRSMA